jgi:hypothetical protein
MKNLVYNRKRTTTAAMPVKKLETPRARSPRYACGDIVSGRRSVVTVLVVWRSNETGSGRELGADII